MATFCHVPPLLRSFMYMLFTPALAESVRSRVWKVNVATPLLLTAACGVLMDIPVLSYEVFEYVPPVGLPPVHQPKYNPSWISESVLLRYS